MIVEPVTRPTLWDAYVESAAPHALHHRWMWREVIEETFGHRSYYLGAFEGGSMCGALPLVFMDSFLFGRFLVSIPFFTYGGLIADNEQASAALLAAAENLARDTGARHIELRQGESLRFPARSPWSESAVKVTMEIPLPPTPDEYWKTLSSGMRNKIRNGEKQGLRAAWSGVEALPAFYKVFSANMRSLGTPVYAQRFFENQIRRMPGKIRILTLWDGATPVASSFLTAHGERLELPWAASLVKSRKKYSQVLMYWTFIRKAIEEGFRVIDLGRCTPGSGTYEFKRHWNPVERPLHWYYWLAPGAEMPRLRPDNGKFKLAIEVWKRLPLAITNGLGPRVVRSIP